VGTTKFISLEPVFVLPAQQASRHKMILVTYFIHGVDGQYNGEVGGSVQPVYTGRKGTHGECVVKPTLATSMARM
jgi:hypothetical protein